jgi:hypothetical protein
MITAVLGPKDRSGTPRERAAQEHRASGNRRQMRHADWSVAFVHRRKRMVSDGAREVRHDCLGGVPMLRPCNPDATIQLLRLVLTSKPEDVELELVFDLVAQLVTDLRGWVPEDF